MIIAVRKSDSAHRARGPSPHEGWVPHDWWVGGGKGAPSSNPSPDCFFFSCAEIFKILLDCTVGASSVFDTCVIYHIMC